MRKERGISEDAQRERKTYRDGTDSSTASCGSWRNDIQRFEELRPSIAWVRPKKGVERTNPTNRVTYLRSAKR